MSKGVLWFRFYTEAIDSGKLRLLAFEDRWHYVALLCLKGAGELDQSEKFFKRKIAVKMGIDLATLDEVARRLSEVDLIDKDTLEPIGWEKRQFASDNSKERVASYRARKKTSKNNNENHNKDVCNGDVTLQKRYSNAGVTPPDTDTDTYINTEKKIIKEKIEPPIEPKTEKANAPRKRVVINKPDDVTDQTWNDFKMHRKEIRAVVTETVIKQFRAEAEKAGCTLDEAMQICCARGWRGFKAEWCNDNQPKSSRHMTADERRASQTALFMPSTMEKLKSQFSEQEPIPQSMFTIPVEKNEVKQ